MTMNTHVTEKLLSFFYDGLLDEQESKAVADHLEKCESCQALLETYECFDNVLQTDLTEDEIQQLLGNNLKEVHERILESERQERTIAQPFWVWFLTPRNLLAGLAVFVMFCGAISLLNQEQGGSFLAMFNGEEREVTEELETPPPLSVAQQEAIVTVARWAKSTAGNGFQYAKEKTEVVGDTFASIQKGTDIALTRGILTASNTDQESIDAAEEEESASTLQKLVKVGRKQVVMGLMSLCASILTLLPIF